MPTRLQARVGYVYDQAAPIGDVVVGSPTAQELELTFVGRAAHAGMYPEEGRSAVLAAARAIVDMPLGRIDEVTSANVGLVRGGTARNVVPERCSLEAEVRSHDDARVTRGGAADRRRRSVRSEPLGMQPRDPCRAEVPRLPVPRRRSRRAPRGRGAGPRRATPRGSGFRAARPTRTSSTPAASSASTSRTG